MKLLKKKKAWQLTALLVTASFVAAEYLVGDVMVWTGFIHK